MTEGSSLSARKFYTRPRFGTKVLEDIFLGFVGNCNVFRTLVDPLPR